MISFMLTKQQIQSTGNTHCNFTEKFYHNLIRFCQKKGLMCTKKSPITVRHLSFKKQLSGCISHSFKIIRKRIKLLSINYTFLNLLS